MNATSKTLAYDHATAEHAATSVQADVTLVADANRLGGMDNKEFRAGFYVGTIAAVIAQRDGVPLNMESGAAVMMAMQPINRSKKDTDETWKNRQAARRAAIKEGTVTERTPEQMRVYAIAAKRFSRFTDAHPHMKVQEREDAGKTKPAVKEKAKDATPKAVNAKQADSYIRMQAAVLKAYAEKNATILPDALRFAILEFSEAVDTVPVALSDAETK
jgi:hypothetical protein